MKRCSSASWYRLSVCSWMVCRSGCEVDCSLLFVAVAVLLGLLGGLVGCGDTRFCAGGDAFDGDGELGGSGSGGDVFDCVGLIGVVCSGSLCGLSNSSFCERVGARLGMGSACGGGDSAFGSVLSMVLSGSGMLGGAVGDCVMLDDDGCCEDDAAWFV